MFRWKGRKEGGGGGVLQFLTRKGMGLAVGGATTCKPSESTLSKSFLQLYVSEIPFVRQAAPFGQKNLFSDVKFTDRFPFLHVPLKFLETLQSSLYVKIKVSILSYLTLIGLARTVLN